MHHAAIADAEYRNGHPTNPLTGFGRRQRDLERDFREKRAPKRITPAQTLTLFVASGLITNQMLRVLAAQARFFTLVMQTFLRAR